MKLTKYLIMTAILIFVVSAINAGNVAVIVHPDSKLTSASAEDVTKLYLGKSKKLGTEKVTPVDQPVASDIRASFSDNILGQSASKVEKYWKKRVFSGKGEPPKTLSGDQAVIGFVAENPNAIGYISAGSLNNKVKKIEVK